MDYSLFARKNKPKKKVVKKHVASIIDQMLYNKQDNLTKFNQISTYQPYYNSYSTNTDYGYSIDDFNGAKKSDYYRQKESIINETRKPSDEKNTTDDNNTNKLMHEMNSKYPLLKDVISRENIYVLPPTIQKSDIIWLINFIEMVNNRPDFNGIEQNISITYFSSFLPLVNKLEIYLQTANFESKTSDEHEFFELDSDFNDDYFMFD